MMALRILAEVTNENIILQNVRAAIRNELEHL